MNGDRKPLFWLSGEIKSPPFTEAARIEAGDLLRDIQIGNSIGMPLSRPMPSIGSRCHELRVRDEDHHWRIIYRIDSSTVTDWRKLKRSFLLQPRRGDRQ